MTGVDDQRGQTVIVIVDGVEIGRGVMEFSGAPVEHFNHSLNFGVEVTLTLAPDSPCRSLSEFTAAMTALDAMPLRTAMPAHERPRATKADWRRSMKQGR